MIQRRKRNSSRVNLIISAVFHSLLILAVFFFAAREGMLGKTLKQITVTMVPKEKKPEPPKEKAPEPKIAQPKMAEAPKPLVATAPPKVETASPPVDAAPAVAPAPASLPAFDFHDGAHDVQSVSDPSGVYKAMIEHALRARWDRPEDLDDAAFVAEVELSVDASGQLSASRWLKGSGNAQWDNSVKAALAKTRGFSRQPPKGFPATFVVRFDVESSQVENAMQISSR